MQIIINIPDEAYELLKNKQVLDNIAECIIANGTPLPKGHGDLIDRDVAYEEFDKACCSYEGGLLQYVPTVIPRDK